MLKKYTLVLHFSNQTGTLPQITILKSFEYWKLDPHGYPYLN